MHGHEGHAHTHGHEQTAQVVQEESCGSGCGCGANAQAQVQGGCGEGCGCSGGNQFTEVETAILQGFLSGLYASTLTREKLAEYLATMSKADGSEFQGPAVFLGGALEATPTDSPKPVAVALLETVTGEPV